MAAIPTPPFERIKKIRRQLTELEMECQPDNNGEVDMVQIMSRIDSINADLLSVQSYMGEFCNGSSVDIEHERGHPLYVEKVPPRTLHKL